MSAPLEHARLALAGAASALVVLPGEGTPIAFLVTVGRRPVDLVVPLRAGENFIGRGRRARWPEPRAVEQSQWMIACHPGRAEIWDAASTNLSELIRAGAGETVTLPHPNQPAPRHRIPLAEALGRVSGRATSVRRPRPRPPRRREFGTRRPLAGSSRAACRTQRSRPQPGA